MRAPEPLHGLRVVARPAAIDAIAAPSGGLVLRIAPDDAIVTGTATVAVDDPYAIVEAEHTFVHWLLDPAEFDAIANHIEWPLPERGELGQGLIAGVPAKIRIDTDHVMLIVSRGLAHEVLERVW